MLKLENITLKFGKRTILDDISLEIKEGTIVTITGKSGTGKTTLLGIISGLLNPDKGKVFYKGKNILHWGDIRRSIYRNRRIGFVFQFFNLLPDLTSFDNIIYPATLNPFSKDRKKEALHLLDYLNIDMIKNKYPETLSGGERQRVAIARAIINNPDIILADEPTGNLDVESAIDIKNLFLKLKKENSKTIIVVTHDQGIVDISDEHYHLEDGILTRINGKKFNGSVKAKVPKEQSKKAKTIKTDKVPKNTKKRSNKAK